MRPEPRRLQMVLALSAAVSLCVVGCAKKDVILELSGSIIYEKPRLTRISYDVRDSRPDGAFAVQVEMAGDPGLTATFDITPGIAVHHPMREVQPGVYRGEFSFPPDVVGGPFTVIGRLEHEQAGEVVLRDPALLTISIIDRR